jgi:hypothetical protein
MFRSIRRLPYFKILAIAQIALLARRHLTALSPTERRRMAELARRGRTLTPAERHEFIDLASKLEPRAFAVAAADHVSPLPLPKKLLSGRGSRRSSSRSH